ncbi:phenolic glucoside malonyltransferase 2-like [Lolium rigidum]|uniref:phenolic glucoside malonyltransferase 2-like n=1 Tax=Lolium rigidum TaxID=89674 RepID=UPI001F5CE5F2|nr:phenolic glucoside malonyltransferase 2-like [Lolium rigidum]
MSAVRVIDASYVSVPATATPSPEPIKLNAMEAQWLTFFPVVQRVLLFDLDGADHTSPFDTVLECLRSSLAATLSSFAPLAGKLVHLKDTGDVGISCSATDGVRFVVAESDADIRRLSGDEEYDISVLRLLVPEVDMSELPVRVLAVQVTRLDGGMGMALGVTVHHAVADGRSLWAFVEAWATACRGNTPAAATPTFDRSLVKLPRGDELAREVLQKFAPNLPLATLPMPTTGETIRPFTRVRGFTLEKQDIELLKKRIIHLSESNGVYLLSHPLSAFAAIAGLAWTCFVRCKQFSGDDDVLFFFFADARRRLDPPVDEAYTGSCLTGCLARLPAGELQADHALVAAASAVQDEVCKMAKDPVAGLDFLTPLLTVDMDRLMHVSGSPGFKAYEVADFGWGRPRWTENARMNDDGHVVLMRAKDGHGVQVSVSLLLPAQMDEFQAQFLKLLQR